MAARTPTLYEPKIDDDTSAAFVAVHIPLRLIGFCAALCVALVLASLVSWSVSDPSLSFANDKSPQNWLGLPGATIADLAMQFFGLASLIAILPPAVWSWGLTKKRVPGNFLLRLLAFAGAVLVWSGLFAFVTPPATWPLPTGLGGLVGGLFAGTAAAVTGQELNQFSTLLYAGILAAPALALLWLAMGLRSLHMPGETPAEPKEDFSADDTKLRTGFFDVVFGGLIHLALSARTAWRRARAAARQRAADLAEEENQSWRREAIEPDLEGGGAPGRREPALNDQTEFAAEHGRDPHDYDYTDADADLYTGDQIARHIAQISGPGEIPVASRRVARPQAQVRPGRRIVSEAQGSLLEDEGFQLPELSLLAEPQAGGVRPEHQPEKLEARARQLEGVLEDFGVKGDIINVRPGPVVTLYELEPAPGIKSSRVISLADDIARSMSAVSARVAVVPGRNAIGIELPNQTRETVYLREMLASSDFEKIKGKLPICLGKTIGGEPVIADLARMPHLLIAGTTGSGKSVGINTMILSLLYRMTPEQCRLIMIDPKMLELSVYDGIPHLLSPVVTDPKKAVVALKWVVGEMEERYRKMSKMGVRNIEGYNGRVREALAKNEMFSRTVQTGFDDETGDPIFETEEFAPEKMPYIVVIVDEMAHESPFVRLFRGNEVARERHVFGAVDPDRSRQALGQTRARQYAHAAVCVRETGTAPRHQNVAGQGELEAAR